MDFMFFYGIFGYVQNSMGMFDEQDLSTNTAEKKIEREKKREIKSFLCSE